MMQATTTEFNAARNPSEHPLETSFPPNRAGQLLFWIAVAFSAFQVLTAAHLID